MKVFMLITFGECAASKAASSTFPASNNWNENTLSCVVYVLTDKIDLIINESQRRQLLSCMKW